MRARYDVGVASRLLLAFLRNDSSLGAEAGAMFVAVYMQAVIGFIVPDEVPV